MNEELAGRTCIVTGASRGIGRMVVGGLAERGAKVIMACRDASRGRSAVEEIRADTGNEDLHLMEVDLSRQRSIRRFAADVLEKHDGLHVLVNNAAVWPRERELTDEGIEVTWATNVLGYFLLTNLLLERLTQHAPARIINVASRFARDLDLEDLQFDRRTFVAVAAYAQSKQANRMLTWALAERVEGTGVTANAVHPGVAASGLLDRQQGMVGAILSMGMKLLGQAPGKGADTVIWLASEPVGAEANGKFWMHHREIPCKFRDPDQAEALWRKCQSMTVPPEDAEAAVQRISTSPPSDS